MNKIKNSFSKIKASDNFKDKLERELLNNAAKFNCNTKKIHHRPSIKAAAILLLFIGAISFKLGMNNIYRNSTPESIAYVPKDEVNNNDYVSDVNQTSNNTYALENNESNNKNEDITENSNNLNNKSTNNIISPRINENKVSSEEEISTKNSNANKNVVSTYSDINEDSNSMPPKVIVNSSQDTIPSSNTNKNNIQNEIKTLSSSMQNVDINSVYIPKFQLPSITKNISAKMIPLIVYKGNVYLYTPIIIDSKNVINFLGRKLGTTVGNINEWNTQSSYSKELVSNIGNTDVYTVNGYDEDFRIMTDITFEDGTNYSEIYECLNGITIKNGQDFFGKLKIQGNIASAKFQTFNDWNNGIGKFYTIDDINLLNSFVDGLNKSNPFLPEDIESSLGDYRNNDACKHIYLDLKDGSNNISFTILKSGYVYYGEYPNVYFKLDNTLIEKLWDKLDVMNIY
jgi:hypothetical protein